MTEITTIDVQEQTARIERMQEETRKFAAEHRKIDRDWALAPWQVAIGGMTAGAALFGAGAAFMKFVLG
jgi:hypothetical protein